MTDYNRKKRLNRLVNILEKLRQVELNEQARLHAKNAKAREDADAIDAIDLSLCQTWTKFPETWLSCRTSLEAEILHSSQIAKSHGINALGFEKAADRFAARISEMDRNELAKKFSEEILQTLSAGSNLNRSALNKFGDLQAKPNTWRSRN